MVKRKSRYSFIIPMLCFFAFTMQEVGYAEETERQTMLCQVPEVDIVGQDSSKYDFAMRDIHPEEFQLEQEEEESETQESAGTVTCAYGRFQTGLFDIKHSVRTKNFYYLLQANVMDTKGERPNSLFTTYRPRLKLNVPSNKEQEWVLKINYFDKDMGLPGPTDAPTGSAKRRNNDFEIFSQWSYSSDDRTIKVEPYYNISIMNEDVVRPSYKNKVVGINLEGELDENVLNTNFYQNKLNRYYEQVIVDAKIRGNPISFMPDRELRLGLNFFAQERFGLRPGPFIELFLNLNDKYVHKLTISREVEPLDFNQTYLEANYVEVEPAELRPKRHFDISYQIDAHFSSAWRGSIAFAASQIKDMRFWQDNDSNGLYSLVLMEKVNSADIRLSSEYNWTKRFSQFVSLIVFKYRSKDSTYEFVPYQPKQRISMGITYKIDKRLKADFVGEYFGRRYFNGNSKESLSGYFLMHTKLAYDLKDYLTLFVLVDNLLNDHYEIVKGYPNQSRNALGGITVRF